MHSMGAHARSSPHLFLRAPLPSPRHHPHWPDSGQAYFFWQLRTLGVPLVDAVNLGTIASGIMTTLVCDFNYFTAKK